MILVTGASGQLGGALSRQLAARGSRFEAVGRPQFDFENPASVQACFADARPELVINAAAYTAVDKAETEREAAFTGNLHGPLQLARLCAQARIPLIHVSTDYVFDGDKGAPYVETDPTNPNSVYGASKRDGEVAIRAAWERTVILRTAWIYSETGKNFARTMLDAGRVAPVLRVVADQHGAPTAAGDLAAAILQVADRILLGWRAEFGGIFHATGGGETSWHGFATAIFTAAAAQGYRPPELQPIATADWPTPARRPADSRLNCDKLARVFATRLPDWQDSLAQVVGRLLAGQRTASRGERNDAA